MPGRSSFRNRAPDVVWASALAAAAVVLRLLMDPVLADVQPYVTVFIAVMVAALVRGAASGVLCWVLGGGVTLFLFHRAGIGWAWPEPLQMVRLIPASAVAFVGIAIASTHRRWRLAAEEATHRARSALNREKEARTHLDAVFNSTQVLLALTRPDGTIVAINRPALRFVKMDVPEQIVGRPLWELPSWNWDPAAVERLRRAVARAASGEFIRYDEIQRGGAPEHREAIMDFTLTPVRDETGRVILLVPEGRDVTEKRRARQQVELALAHDRAVLASTLDPLVTIDGRGIIQSASRSVERVFGWHPEELVGQSVSVLMPEPHRTSHGTYLADYHRTGQASILGRTREMEAVRKDGSVLPILLSVERVHLPNQGGGPLRPEDELFVGIMHDFSQRKAIEAALARQREELARSNADLEDYARVVAHDLKEPLRGIVNYARFLAEDAGPRLEPEERRKLEGIERLADRMRTLMDNLMEHAKVGRAPLEITSCSMEDVVQEALDHVRGRLETEAVEVEIVGRTFPTVNCDAQRIVQVLTNLIANGIKYNDSPRKRIQLGWRPPIAGTIDHEGPVFFVRDNGIGIEPRHHDAVFAMFRRLHGREQYGGGSGAGLSIVRKIIERHGGHVWLESEAGRGTTVFFSLGRQPQGECTAPAADEPATVASMPGGWANDQQAGPASSS